MRSPVRSRRQLRLAAATALVAAAVMGGSPASAQSGDSVAFTGGCGPLSLGLGASSQPDTAQVSVPPGAGVGFANRLGTPATLSLNGDAVTTVAPGDTAEVSFDDGPVTATMQISCLLGKPAGSVTIDVVSGDRPASSSSPAPSDSPGPSDPAGAASPGGTGPAAPGSGTAGSGSGSDAGFPGPAAPGTPGAPGFAAPVPGEWPGQPGGAGDPAEDPAGADDPERGSDDELGARWGDRADGGDSPLSPATVDGQAADDGLATDQLARTAGSTPSEGQIGLLALIAIVCVVGVSAGAVRAIITQRANRAELA